MRSMYRFRFFSLRFFLIALVLLALVPSLGLMVYTASAARQREMAHTEAEALQLAHIISIEEQQLIEGTEQVLKVLAQHPLLQVGDPQACDAFLAGLRPHFQRYADLGVIAPDGTVSCSAVSTEGVTNVADLDFFQQALSSGEFTVGEYQMDPISQGGIVPFAYPVHSKANQIQAVIFATLKMDWLNRVESAVLAQLPPSATLTKVDPKGMVVVHEPDPTDWEGRSALQTPLVKDVLERGQGVAEIVGLDGVLGVYAFAPVPSVFHRQGLFVILGIPRGTAFAECNRILLRSLAGLGLVAAAVLAGTWVAGNVFIVRPVEALLRVNRQLARGDLSARVSVQGGPQELTQLGLALNHMADNLEQSDGDLRQISERLSILHEMDSAILDAISPEEIAYAALSRITQIILCLRACVVTFDFETHEAMLLALHADGETLLGEGTRVSLEVFEDVEFETLRRGEVHLLENARSLCQPSAIGPALRATVPLILQDELIGSLNLELDDPEALMQDHVRIAGEVAASVAVAIHSARLLEEVRAGHERLQTLSHRLIEVQEVERRHIARELHDEIGQALTSVKINLRTMQRLNDSSTLAMHLEDSVRVVDRALQQVRSLSFDLRPSLLDDLGLVPALRSLVKRQAQRAGFSASFHAGPVQQRIPPQVEVACFRIVQEALTNVMRHAQTSRVVVELRVEKDGLNLLIHDDGAGFDVKAALQRAARGGSLGVLGMKERAILAGGRLTIESTPGQGTDVRARFSLTQESTGDGHRRGGDTA